jgi:hypothetical protein
VREAVFIRVMPVSFNIRYLEVGLFLESITGQ